MSLTAPHPMRKPEAPLLPTGFRRSAWKDLDPHGRLLLYNELVSANPDLRITGGVDFDSPFEPLLTDSAGRQVSLTGEVINDGTGPLNVDITEGTVVKRDRDNRFLIFGLLALAGVALLSKS